MSLDERPGSRALESLTGLGRNYVQRPGKAELERGLEALQLRMATHRVRQRRLVRWSSIAVVVVTSILLAWQVSAMLHRHWSTSEPKSLAYRIEGGTVLDGGYLHESGQHGIKLRFNEGSTFDLAQGTRGRLRSVDKDGARVAIENGTASFDIVPGSNRHWLVEVGPFMVAVKGTVFTVVWDPRIERFELTLQRGHVVVNGPVSGGDLALRSGQRLVVSLPKAETLITEYQATDELRAFVDAAAPRLTEPPVPQPPVTAGAPSSAPAGSAAAPGAMATKRAPERRWANALASGHWDHILEEVEQQGLDTVLNRASIDDLFALADAARYRRRPDLARSALLAERRRFPDSPRTLDALFLLGRVEESRGASDRAITWYDDYLARAPLGGYAAEALGRKMTITKAMGGADRARPLAEEYLRRFPRGSYAGSARTLLGLP